MKKLFSVLGRVLVILLLAISAAWLAAIRWVTNTWAHLTMEELVYQLNAPMQGTNSDIVLQGVLQIGIPLAAAAVLTVIILHKFRKPALCATLAAAAIVSDLAGGWYVWNRLDVGVYLKNQGTDSTFIAEHYVDPSSVDLTFPEKKRNLIYIFLESMEITYTDESSGGGFGQTDVIPELTQLALVNESFSGDAQHINGGYAMPGATWTMGGMFAQTSGLPLKSAITDADNGSMSTQRQFFPSITCLGAILAQAGYKQVLMVGSDGSFAGRSLYFSEHGNYEIQDYNCAIDTGLIPPDYNVWWGYEDQRLFANAKNELQKLAALDEPFNLTMLTVDTHFEDGYVCDLCEDAFGDNQYANVIACSSKQVAEFVQWVQQQDFYADTTIVISGDHLTMDSDFCNDVPADYERRTYTAYINAASEKKTAQTRTYTTFDNFPTTLAALGVQIDGNRLGLGTNLFSDVPTEAEEYGVDELSGEIAKYSSFVEGLSGVDMENFHLISGIDTYETGTIKVVASDSQHADVIIHDAADFKEPVQKVWVEISRADGSHVKKFPAKLKSDRCYHASINLKDYERGYGTMKVQTMLANGEVATNLDYTGNLLLVGDFQSYIDNLNLLKNDGYAYLFAVQEEGINALSPAMQESLHNLGFSADLSQGFRAGYLAIYDGTEYREQLAFDALQASGTFPDGTSYSAISSGRDQGCNADIAINDLSYTKSERGMNIVVYDYVKSRVVNCAHFDTYQKPPEITVYRTEDGQYEFRINSNGLDAWNYYPMRLCVWDKAACKQPRECILEHRDDGLYGGTLDLSGLDTNKLYVSIYQELYPTWVYCLQSTYGPLIVAE